MPSFYFQEKLDFRISSSGKWAIVIIGYIFISLINDNNLNVNSNSKDQPRKKSQQVRSIPDYEIISAEKLKSLSKASVKDFVPPAK